VTAPGGQWLHRSSGARAGAPQRSHLGGPSGINRARQAVQKGQGPAPHPAQRFGKSASSSEPSTGGR
jgi:hypothetical protein